MSKQTRVMEPTISSQDISEVIGEIKAALEHAVSWEMTSVRGYRACFEPVAKDPDGYTTNAPDEGEYRITLRIRAKVID